MEDSKYSFNPQNTSISPPKYLNQKLWKLSETTLSFVSPRVSFPKEERFKLNSIYWPQKQTNPIIRMNKQRSEIYQVAKKISKQIDQQEKNQKRMKNQSNKVSANHKHKKSLGKRPSIQQKKSFKLSDQNQRIIQRLGTSLTKRQSSLRDRHGNRNNMYQDTEQLLPFLKTQYVQMNSSTGFNSGRRVKLNLPHNYYPGPGTYQIKRYLQKKQELLNK